MSALLAAQQELLDKLRQDAASRSVVEVVPHFEPRGADAAAGGGGGGGISAAGSLVAAVIPGGERGAQNSLTFRRTDDFG